MDTTKTVTHIGLCAGYGGIELGLKRVLPNLRSIALCEIEAFACANLVAKMEAGLMDAAPIWTDLKTFHWDEFRDRVDILTGGYPCQPFSAAGKRLGTEDPRHLWPFIADGIRLLRPRICFFENVEGHISLGLREVVGELESIGYQAAWGIFSAVEVGAPHQRKRVFILAVSNSLGGAAGVSRSLAWNERVAGVADNGGIEGCGELADSCNGSNPAHGYAEAHRLPSEHWQEVCSRFAGGANATSWPSRPGKPQHGWEPPRVVDSASARQQTQQDQSNGQRQEGLAGEPSELGNAPQRQDHGRECRDMGIAAGEGRCGNDAADGTSEVLGNAHSPRPQERQGQRGAGIQGTHADGGEDADRQIEPTLGGDADGSAGGLGYAELQVTCDNRTDELRLLGNGVVPATAELAFRTLFAELTSNPNPAREG